MTVVRAGGIAGLVTSVVADTAVLGPADAESLREHASRAGLLAGPTPAATSAPRPDRFDEEIVVEHDGVRSELRVREQDASAEVADLVRFVRLLPGTTEEIGPPS